MFDAAVLGEDLVAQILRQLPLRALCRAGATNTTWQEIATRDNLVLSCLDLSDCTQPDQVANPALMKRAAKGAENICAHGGLIPADLLETALLASPRLTTLDFDHAFKGVTPDVLQLAAKHCPGLTSVNLRRCHNVDDTALIALSQGCTRLTSLDVSFCSQITDQGVVAVAGACPLVVLRTLACDEVGDVAVEAVAERCGSSLTELDLGLAHRVTAEGMERFGGKLSCLTSLSLEGCSALNQKSLQTIISSSVTSPLRHLNLRGCYWLAGRGIATIADGCPGLMSLDISTCSQVDDERLLPLLLLCKTLQSLAVGRCRKLTDETMRVASTEMVRLRQLDISRLTNMTETSLQYIRTGFPALTEVNIFHSIEYNLSGPREELVGRLRQDRPCLDVIDVDVTSKRNLTHTHLNFRVPS